MGTIFLCRHARTIWNEEGRQQGMKDSPLSPAGIKQARNMRWLLEFEPRPIFCSPLGRVRETARIMGCENVTWDHNIRETCFGDCEGLTRAEIAERFPGFLEQREADRWNTRWPNGESYADAYIRAAAFIVDVRNWQRMGYNRILIVAHESINRLLAMAYSGYDEEHTLRLKQPNDIVWVL